MQESGSPGDAALATTCAVCGGKARVSFRQLEIPHFGRLMHSLLLCEDCGYRHADIISLEQREPAKYTLRVETPEDLNARVVRSSRGRVELPELGVTIEPAAEAQGFITNVEGVLHRVKEVLESCVRWAEDEQKRRRAEELAERVRRVVEGEERVTIVISDPTGCSAIISEKAVKEVLDAAEG
ncbi:MAG: ZPR1 zinc finger domain-containing protein [Euryarchaeota archaeon]|nr:ZPR1 zinc finger domain-containing protein [Euryarchaeota archaeon]